MAKTRRGPRPIYGPKDPPSKSSLLTQFAKTLLRTAVARSGGNESCVIEHLIRCHSGDIAVGHFDPLEEGETS